MHAEPWCGCCSRRQSDCRCTPAELDRHEKLLELESVRRRIAVLERELGITPAPEGNRHERRASAAARRKR